MAGAKSLDVRAGARARGRASRRLDCGGAASGSKTDEPCLPTESVCAGIPGRRARGAGGPPTSLSGMLGWVVGLCGRGMALLLAYLWLWCRLLRRRSGRRRAPSFAADWSRVSCGGSRHLGGGVDGGGSSSSSVAGQGRPVDARRCTGAVAGSVGDVKGEVELAG